MRSNRCPTILCLAFFVLILFTESTFGCQCSGYQSICEDYSNADVVIIGTVKEIKSETKKNENRYTFAEKNVTVEVLKSFKGTNKKEITLHNWGSSCEWNFTENHKEKTYLFYLYSLKEKDMYTVFSCGRSQSIDTADDELSWLNGLPNSLERTRFSGSIRQTVNNPEFNFTDFLLDSKVKLFNDENSFDVIPDKNGKYEIWDIPIGKYKIRPEFPLKYRFKLDMYGRGSLTITSLPMMLEGTNTFKETEYSVEIKKNGCAEMDYILNKND